MSSRRQHQSASASDAALRAGAPNQLWQSDLFTFQLKAQETARLHMMKKEYKRLVRDIAELLLRHDPVGLKAETNLPMDEYEAEAMAIAAGLRHCRDGHSCLAVVVKIFRDSFGEAIAGPEESYRPLAAEVWNRFRVDLDTR